MREKFRCGEVLEILSGESQFETIGEPGLLRRGRSFPDPWTASRPVTDACVGGAKRGLIRTIIDGAETIAGVVRSKIGMRFNERTGE